MTTTLAAVATKPSAPFELQELELDAPQGDEILVKMVAAGVCHSDISARDFGLPFPLPMVFGHEGAGIVEEVGPGVRGLKPGDHVVLTRLTCMMCRNCQEGNENFCEVQDLMNFAGQRIDGSTTLHASDGSNVHGQFFGQSSFATYSLAHERNAIKLDPDFDLRIAPAFACGVLTGAGTVLNRDQNVVGQSAAVFGVGPVGVAAMLAAKLSGFSTIIAVDRFDNRLELAKELGATHTIKAEGQSMEEAVRSIVPTGLDFAVDATGVTSVAKEAVLCLDRGGELALLGIPPAGQQMEFEHMRFAFMGQTIKSYPSGLSRPSKIIPLLMRLHAEGKFPIDRLITTYDFRDIEDAIQDSLAGKTLKPILTFDAA